MTTRDVTEGQTIKIATADFEKASFTIIIQQEKLLLFLEIKINFRSENPTTTVDILSLHYTFLILCMVEFYRRL